MANVDLLSRETLWSNRYLLQPKGNGNKSKCDDLGSLRLRLTYIEDTVLPSACYTPLCNLLLKSPDVKVQQAQVITLNLKHRRSAFILSTLSLIHSVFFFLNH